ncbi:MAG: hypothetical protein JW976_02530 [Syntrophaceae bacterium]|nr:hypothetical protein [Syntrophaceae bacterium]
MINKIRFETILDITLLFFSCCLILFTLKNPFYWDNIVQTSVPANWYYETNFKFFYLPDEISTGHPTFVGMYFALLWKIFGRSLAVSHFGMLPFVFGVLVQIRYFLKNINITDKLPVSLIMGFVIVDTTFLSQLSLITFDIIQLFFFFLCLNLLIVNKNKVFAVSYLILIMISLRASVMAGGILIFNVLYDYFSLNKKIRIRDYVKYIPGVFSLFLFLLLFKINKGWVVHNTVSDAWDTSGQYASFYRMIWNTIILIWRLIDFGRIGIFIVLLFFLFKSISIRKFQDDTVRILFLIIISQFILFFPILVTSQIPFGHRYFLPIIVPAIILAIYWIINYTRLSQLWLTCIFILLISGHFWLYPMGVSQGWDATTIHWNYFRVSEEMYSYIEENNIQKDQIGTFFPNNNSRYLSHIGTDKSDIYGGVPFQNKYVLYSNAFNVHPEVLSTLFSESSDWKLIKKFTRNRIFIGLYTKAQDN